MDATGLLDTDASIAFDRIASLAARVLGAPFAFLTVVDDSRSFWKSAIGLDAASLEDRQNRVEESFCQYVIGLDEALLIGDVRLDPRTRDNSSIESMGVVAWAGAPLRSAEGDVLGTLCVVDTDVRSWSDDDADVLHDLAAIATDEITANRASAAALRAESLLSSVLQRAPIGFALVDEQMRYEVVNEALATINGLTIDEHIGRTMDDVVPGVSDAAAPLIRGVMDSGEPVIGVEMSGHTPSQPGVERTWSVNFYRLDLQGDRRAGLFVEEVTERVAVRLQAQRLASITDHLSRAFCPEDVAVVIATEIAEYFGATEAALGMVDRSSRALTIHPGDDVPTEVDGRTLSIDDHTAYGAPARSGQPEFASNAEDRTSRFEHDFSPEIEASTVFPCRSADGSTIAVLGIGWSRRIESDQFPFDQLATMAALIGNVLERNRAADDRRNLIESLQSTLLAAPDQINGMDIATRYQPAGDVLGFGGDWYDVVPLDEYGTALVVGDVVGHDGAAAAHMTQVRTTFSDLLLLDTPITEVFDKMNQLLQARPSSTMATVGVVVVRTDERTISAVSAGHLPSLIIQPDGTADILTPALRPPLLVDGPLPVIDSIHYQSGATIVMFTDGLIETRDARIDDDLEHLRQYLISQRGVDPHSLADRLLDDYARRTERSDDIAIVCARLD